VDKEDLQGGIIGEGGRARARRFGRWEGSKEGLGAMEEGEEAGSSKTGRE